MVICEAVNSRPHPCLIVILRQLLVDMERKGGAAPQTVWWIYIGGRCTNYRPNKFYSLTLTPPPQSSNHSKSLRFRGSLINASTSRADLVKVGARLFRARDSADVMWSCLAAELKRVSCGRKLADITNSDNGNNSSHKPARWRTQYSPHISDTYAFRRIRYGYLNRRFMLMNTLSSRSATTPTRVSPRARTVTRVVA